MSKEDTLYDPEPLSIAFTIIGAVAPIGVLIAERTFKKVDDQQERVQAVRNLLFDASRALNNAERVLKDFGSYIDQQGYLSRPFRLGKAPLQGDEELVNRVRLLYSSSWEAGRDLNDAMISLSRLLNNQDFQLCVHYSEELDEQLRRTYQADTYKNYLTRMSRLIEQARRLVQKLGERYHIETGENYR